MLNNVTVYSVYTDLLYNALYYILPWSSYECLLQNWLQKIDKTLDVIMRKKSKSIFPAYLYTAYISGTMYMALT